MTPRVEHNVPVGCDLREAESQSLAHAAPGAVSFHGASKGSGEGKAQARASAVAFDTQAEGGEIRARNADAGIIDLAEIGRAKDTSAFWKAIANSRTGRLFRH